MPLVFEYFQPWWLFSFGEQDPVYLDDQGLVLVVGTNLDEPGAGSNEAGKTAFLEALVWTLTGRSLRFGDRPGDAVVHVDRPKGAGTYGMVTFRVDDIRYKVTRARQHPTLRSDVYFHQELPDDEQGEDGDEWTDLRGHDGEATTERILATLGFDFSLFWYALGFAQDETYRFASATDSTVKRVLAKILQFNVIDDCLTYVRAHKARLRSSQADDEAAIQACQAVLDEQDAALKELEFTEAAARQGRRKEEAIAGLQLRMAGPARAATEILAIQTQLRQSTARYRQLQTELRPVESALATLDERVTTTARQRESKALTQQTLREARDTSEAELGAPCTGCGRVLTKKELPFLEQHYNRDIGALTVQLKELAKLEQKLKTDRIPLLRDQRRVTEAMTVLDRQQEDWSERITRLTPEADQLPELQAELHRLQGSDGPTETPARLRKRIWMVQAREKKKQRELHAAVREYDRQHTVCDHALDLWTGLKSYLIGDAIPILNRATTEALRFLTDGTTTVRFTATSENKQGEERDIIGREVISSSSVPYEGRSTGWRRRIDLAEAYALQRLLAARYGRHLGLAAYDDVFAELDDEGRSRTLLWLQDIATKTGTVLVMSPTDSILPYFQTVWRVTKEHGISRLEVQ